MAAETKIINPYDRRVVASVPVFSQQDVDDAIGRAAQTSPALADMHIARRAHILHKAAALIEEYTDSLARLIVRESGKPLKLAQIEVRQTVEIFTRAAGEASRLHDEALDLSRRVGWMRRVPAGVVAAIIPFHEPLADAVRWLAPAVAAGCPLLLHPAPFTPLTALRLSDILEHAGLPKGGFEVVLGEANVAHWLASDSRVTHLAFTGSQDGAASIVQLAGLRRVSLELRGRAAAVIDSDADVPRAVARCVTGAFAYSGQLDTCPRHIYVHRSRYDAFRQRFVDATADVVIGNPIEENTLIGPLISDAAAERVIALANSAIEEGAWLLAGGERDGCIVAPLVLENVDEVMQIMHADAPGPVVCLLPFDKLPDTLQAISHPDVHLSLFTHDLERARRTAQGLHAASVTINDVPTRYVSAASIRRTMDAMTDLQTVVMSIQL
jgi:acyl-CoA reductase-like NAD-dependent aldehyde dehydrogenase